MTDTCKNINFATSDGNNKSLFRRFLNESTSARGRKIATRKSKDQMFAMCNHYTGKYHCQRCDKIFSTKYGLQCHHQLHLGNFRVPTRTGKTGKPGKMGRHFPVREKSGNFEQTGKVGEKRENYTKYWKTQGIS